MKHLPKMLADKLVSIATTQYKTGYEFKKSRMLDIQKNEEFYQTRKIRVPTGRFGVPLPTMSGFVDTLMSKIDDPPIISYGYTDLADLKLSQKISALWQKEKSPNKGNWPQKDRWGKKLACFSGRSIFKIYSESDPHYKNNLEVVDHEDFVCEPMGGGDLENHLYKGVDNIFKTKAQLQSSQIYEPTQIKELLDKVNNEEFKRNEDLWKNKAKRLASLGLNLTENTYVGQPIFKFIEWVMDYRGEEFYLLFEYTTGIWIRAHKLKEVFESNLGPFVSWATHEDAFNFWSKAPCDDVRPIADALDTLFNQALDNRQKRNYQQRAYDSDIFPDPSELEWRPDGLARATPGPNKTIAHGIYNFETPEIAGTIDLIAFMDNFLGRKTGITAESQGAAEEEQKVGIYFGNLQQMADRLGLYNKSYRECWERMGLRYAWGLQEHMNEKMMVKTIGEAGVEWEELTTGEAAKAPDLDIEIKGGSAEIEANAQKSKKRENAQVLIAKDQILREQINSRWRAQEVLKMGEYEEEEVRAALSPENVNLEILSNASQAIQEILKGKQPKTYRTATTAFIQRIIDFASDHELKMEVYNKMMAYAQRHIPIAQENMIRATRKIIVGKGIQPTERPKLKITEGMETEEPVPGTPAGTIKTSQEASNLLRGRTPVIA